MGYIKQAIVFLFFSICTQHVFAQQVKYDTIWSKVNQLLSKEGLTVSAANEVKKAYALAKKENNDAQLVKALIYQAVLLTANEESAEEKAIAALEEERKTTKEPALSILNSVLAERYVLYFERHRWQFYNRTETNVNNDNLETWTIPQLHKKITELYLLSLKNEQLLKQTKIEKFEPIIIKGNVRFLRPTLFDLLAFRALDYFRNEERDVTRPSYAYYINDPNAFADAQRFINYQFATTDSLSLQHKAIQLYQRLLDFHKDDRNPDAFIDADLNRLAFVSQFAQLENKDSLYLTALENITRKFPNYKTGAPAYYEIAEWHATKAATYDARQDSSYRYNYVTAKLIAEKIMASNKGNEAAVRSAALLKNIAAQELLLTTEKVNIPGQAFRTLVRFKNIPNLQLRVIQLNEAIRKQLSGRYDDKYWQQLVSLPALRSWSQPLPATNDFQPHEVEIKVDALPVGDYLLLSSPDQQFDVKNDIMAAQYFKVSSISFVNNNTDYFVLDRETGKPLAGTSVQVWATQYDYNTRKNVFKAVETLQADEHGFFRLKEKQPANGNLRLEFSYKQDRYTEEVNQYEIYRELRGSQAEALSAATFEEKNAHVFFFTDRSIYRPAQKVFFKGIALTKDFSSRENKALSSFKTTVKLFNANDELVDSINVTTNEYGSYSGSFQLPENTLNGSFHLYDEKLKTEMYFSVEEYKRPKFFVEYEELKGTYKINDSIHVTGFAKAYAGNNINGAKVSYSVVREARFLYPWMFWRRGFPQTSRIEIAHGEVTTDSEGRFSLTFKAIPDRSIQPSFDPVFDYKVVADVTDINGETRVGEKLVPVSYKSLQLQINLNESVIAIDSLQTLMISTTNLNGQHESAKVKLQIYKLKAPESVLRKRYWERPDLFLMDKETFISYFPHDEYNAETEPETWNREEKVFESEDTSSVDRPFKIATSRLTEGWYVIEAISSDKDGQQVKDVRYVQLYKPESNELVSQDYQWTAQRFAVIEPGGKSVIGIGSAAKDIFVIQHIDKSLMNESGVAPAQPVYHFLTLNKEKIWLEFSAEEKDRGGFGVNHFFVKDNRFYLLSNIVAVPWTNKALRISYETFRDKTLPGSDEQWKLKISGNKNEKLSAELLASMYDASLDQFKPHSWERPDIWPVYFGYNNRWTGNYSFNDVSSQEKYVQDNTISSYQKQYDQLMLPPQERSVDRLMKRGMTAGVEVQAMAPSAMMRDANQSNLVFDNLSEEEGSTKKEEVPKQENVGNQPRKNFNETAFFFPDLKTDAEGNIEFRFTIPEALTKWKFQALSHTKDLAFGISSKEVITQKELMVQPNAPRFLREGDRLELSTKIVNLSTKEITGTIRLELFNAATMQPVDGWFQNAMANQYFTAAAGQSVSASFRLEVPYQYNSALVYRFTAMSAADASGNIAYSDGEEAALPVVSNSMLVTETMPLPMLGNESKNFSFDKLLNAGKSETLKPHALTVEFSANPAWYAVQALPYLAEPAVESADFLFNRFYANALASKIANSSPRIREVFERWKTTDTAALLSNLQKKQELKSVLLEETPWVLEAKTEAEQKKNIALLFDLTRMQRELSASLARIKEYQSPNGGFMWFKGGPDDRFMTQRIVSLIGHLKKLDAIPSSLRGDINGIVTPAIKYLDDRMKDDYAKLTKTKNAGLEKNHLNYLQIHYLYMRSFFNDLPIPGASFNAVNYYRKQSQQFWLQQSKYMQGMIALSLHRTGDKAKAEMILKSLLENSTYNPELGRYWKQIVRGYFWYQAPVETQSLLIEAFAEIKPNEKTVNEMKTWLLKEKQTSHWKTNSATADACYALLLSATNGSQTNSWLANTPAVTIRLGDKMIESAVEKQEAGTGYFKKSFDAPFINPFDGIHFSNCFLGRKQ